MKNTAMQLKAALLIAATLSAASPAAAHPAAGLNLSLWTAEARQPAGRITRFSRLAGMFMGTVPCFSFHRLTVRLNLEIR